MTIDDLRRFVAPLHLRVVNLLARATVKLVDDTKRIQVLQIGVLNGETKDGVERLQNFGFTSVPKDGAAAFVAFVGGKRDHGVVIAVDDRRYRIGYLESGEVAMYDATGSTLVFKKNGDIEATPSSGKLKITADVTVTGNLDVSKTVTATTDVVGGGKHLKTHTHKYTDVSDAGSTTSSTEAPT